MYLKDNNYAKCIIKLTGLIDLRFNWINLINLNEFKLINLINLIQFNYLCK